MHTGHHPSEKKMYREIAAHEQNQAKAAVACKVPHTAHPGSHSPQLSAPQQARQVSFSAQFLCSNRCPLRPQVTLGVRTYRSHQAPGSEPPRPSLRTHPSHEYSMDTCASSIRLHLTLAEQGSGRCPLKLRRKIAATASVTHQLLLKTVTGCSWTTPRTVSSIFFSGACSALHCTAPRGPQQTRGEERDREGTTATPALYHPQEPPPTA